MGLAEIVQSNQALSIEQLKSDSVLILEIQQKLNEFGLYPGGRLLDGRYGERTEKGLKKFAQVNNLGSINNQQIDSQFANKLLTVDPTDFRLETARDRASVFQEFLDNQTNGLFLERGIEKSPFKNDVISYPDRLKEKPDGIEVTSLGDSLTLPNGATVNFSPYPNRGIQPTNFDEQGLNFLHEDIKEACACIGSFVNGEIRSHWLGKNAKNNGEFWSATKLFAILNVVDQANSVFSSVDIDNCVIRASGSNNGFAFNEIVVAIENYKNKPASSNSLAATLKRFSTFEQLNQWLKDITGNTTLDYRGQWGEAPFYSSPELFDTNSRKVILKAAPLTTKAGNSVSAYDLTRVISMLGWHHHLPQTARLPGAQWHSLESVVRGAGEDIGRYVDAAIERLGLQRIIKSPVIISKSGWGRSSIRDRYEIPYVAFIQFIDRRPQRNGQLAKLRTLSLALRAAKDLNNSVKEEQVLDARIAAEITEILRRIVTEELA